MVKELFKGSSIGKISGHRKGDISEKFDMAICIQCHNPSHGSGTVYKDFCTRCHDPNKKANIAMGPTHLNSTKWIGYNSLGGGLALFLILGTFVYLGYRSRERLGKTVKDWHDSMKVREETKKDVVVDEEKDEAKDEEKEKPSEKEEDDRPEDSESVIRDEGIEKRDINGQERSEDKEPEREDNEPKS